MKESYVEGLATHDGPESCAVAREGGGEALTGVRAGRVLSRERNSLRGADPVGGWGRPHCRFSAGRDPGLFRSIPPRPRVVAATVLCLTERHLSSPNRGPLLCSAVWPWV